MCGQFESNNHDNSRVDCQTDQPVISINACTIYRQMTYNVKSEKENN